MFAQPGTIGVGIGRLGLGAGALTIVAQALSILAKYGSAANLYLPGVGSINGITAGNWLDSAGQAAATVDNPIGLVINSGSAPGANLTPGGGTFDSGAGWSASPGWVISGGTASFTTADTVGRTIGASAGAIAGRWYLFQCSVTRLTGSWSFFASNVGSTGRTDSGVVTGIYKADEDGTLLFLARAGFTGSIDDFTVRELPGAQLTQSTSANRPILRLAGGVYAWDFVGNDSFESTLTTGNEGWVCAGVGLTTSAPANQTIFYSGAEVDANAGIWLAVAGSQARFRIGDGIGRNALFAATVPIGSVFVLDAGWGGAFVTCATNGVESTLTKTRNPTSTRTIKVGGIVWPMSGTIGATVIMPTVLPTSTERATLRQFIASLSGVTM